MMQTERTLFQQATHSVARAVDHAVIKRALTPSPRNRDRVETLQHQERLGTLRAVNTFYNRPEFEQANSPLFTRTPSLSPNRRKVRSYGAGGTVLDLSWESEFEPMWSSEAAARHFEQILDETSPDTVSPPQHALRHSLRVAKNNDERLGIRHRYGRCIQNKTMHARWFRHKGSPRPCVVILHGYMGGHFLMEEQTWPIRALFDGGMDVVLTVLPMHGVRRDPRKLFRQPEFPGSDPRSAIEGFRHLVHDHLSLFDYLLDGRVQSLGTLGMSLGGYSAALLSTITDQLQFGVFYMPLASVADFALRTGRMVGTREEQAVQAQALDDAYRSVSPLARPSQLPPGRALVISGQADMVTGVRHGHQLAQHFDAPTSHFSGGHILQIGRSSAFKPMWSMLQEAGLHNP